MSTSDSGDGDGEGQGDAGDTTPTTSIGASSSHTLAQAANKHGGDGQVRPELAVLSSAIGGGDSDLLRRYAAARYAGLQFGADRDMYDTLGYDRDPGVQDYYAKYLRNDIARTVVKKPAATSWQVRPRVIDDAEKGPEDEAETPFERAVEYLFEQKRLLHYLKRWDVATGLGEYGVLFLGLREATGGDEDMQVDYSTLPDLTEPPDPNALDEINPDERDSGGLAYMSVFTQGHVEDIQIVENPAHPRFGLPHRYQLEFVTGDSSRTQWVHYSRVLHAAEDLLENEIFGTPRMLPVYNRIMDLEKVVGGAGEMFWRGARRELHMNYTGDGTPQDADALQEQAEEYTHRLRNVLRTSNVEAQDLGGQDVNPEGPVDVILQLIAGETGIPKRMLTGSERGELASTQDRASWLQRASQRQEQWNEPVQFRAYLDRLLNFGILPEPQGGTYTVTWPDLFELNDIERAEIRKQNADALNAATGGSPFQVADPPEIREAIMAWDPEMGGETSLDETPEQVEREDEDATDPEEFDESDLDEFEDILDDVQVDSAARDLAADGGQ